MSSYTIPVCFLCGTEILFVSCFIFQLGRRRIYHGFLILSLFRHRIFEGKRIKVEEHPELGLIETRTIFKILHDFYTYDCYVEDPRYDPYWVLVLNKTPRNPKPPFGYNPSYPRTYNRFGIDVLSNFCYGLTGFCI